MLRLKRISWTYLTPLFLEYILAGWLLHVFVEKVSVSRINFLFIFSTIIIIRPCIVILVIWLSMRTSIIIARPRLKGKSRMEHCALRLVVQLIHEILADFQNLADLILEKIAMHESAQSGNPIIQGGGPPEEAVELPMKVIEVYSKYEEHYPFLMSVNHRC